MRNMKYLDANVFIYLALSEGSESKAIAAKNIIEKVVEGSFVSATSSLTWDELVWVVKKFEGKEVAKEEGRKFISLPKLKILSVGESTLYAAQDLVAAYGLKPRDAIHAACCIENGIEEIISDDSDFDGIDGLKRTKLEDALK